MPATHRPMSEALQTRIAAQHAALSRLDALECGHDDHDLCAWSASGTIVQATRGGYYVPPESEAAWAGASLVQLNLEHERRRIRAVLHVVPASFVASHDSALLQYDLPRLQLPDRRGTVWLMATTPDRLVRRKGVHMRTPIPGTLIDARRRTVSVADAIAQTGCVGGRLAALIPADAATNAGRLDLAHLDAACQRMAGRRGVSHLVGLSSLVEARCESPGETRLLAILRDARIEVTPQVWIGDEGGAFARVDCLVDGTRVVLEFDGMIKYDDAEAARNEKKREHRLHRAGYVVVRVIWQDFADIPALLRRIQQAIARAA